MAEQYGIYQAITEDHERLRRLLDQVTQPNGKDLTDVFVNLQEDLTLHVRAEEECLYRPLLRSDTTHAAVLHAFEEHHVVDVLLGELAAGEPGNECWNAKAEVLKDFVQHHLETEEHQLFDGARSAMDQDWATHQAQLYLSEKERLRTQQYAHV